MHENDIAKLIVDASYKIQTALGPGLFESVYEAVLFYELGKLGFVVDRQVPIPVVYSESQPTIKGSISQRHKGAKQ